MTIPCCDCDAPELMGGFVLPLCAACGRIRAEAAGIPTRVEARARRDVDVACPSCGETMLQGSHGPGVCVGPARPVSSMYEPGAAQRRSAGRTLVGDAVVGDPVEGAIEVVGGVIVRVDGGVPRVLLTQRVPPRDFAYVFESPGGKVDPGEPPLVALARELVEEIGVTPSTFGQAIFSGTFPRPRGGRARWTAYPVLSWVGTPRPEEGQGVGWFTEAELSSVTLTPGNRAGLGAIVAHMQRVAQLAETSPEAMAEECGWPTDGPAWRACVAGVRAERARRARGRSTSTPPTPSTPEELAVTGGFSRVWVAFCVGVEAERARLGAGSGTGGDDHR